MKKTLISSILIAILLVVSLQFQAEARFDDRTDAEPYRAGGTWQDQAYSTYGIDGENYISDQNPITTFWQEFVAEMKTELIYVPPWSYEIRATYYITTGYFQYGTSFRRHFVRYRMGYGGTYYMHFEPDIPQVGTYYDYTIMYAGYDGNWRVLVDGGQRLYVTFPELKKCNIQGLTSKNAYWGEAYSTYAELKQLQWSPWGWHYWDGGLDTFAQNHMRSYAVNGRWFVTWATP